MLRAIGKQASKEENAEELFLDSSEQDQIANELKLAATSQSRTTRLLFFYIYLLIAIIFAFCFTYTTIYPWEMSHQEIFQGIVSLVAFQAFYIISCLHFILAAFAVKVREARGGGIYQPTK